MPYRRLIEGTLNRYKEVVNYLLERQVMDDVIAELDTGTSHDTQQFLNTMQIQYGEIPW